MSGPVGLDEAPAAAARGVPGPPAVEIGEARDAQVGRFHVRRALPRRNRRTVGPWCFADHFGPAEVEEEYGLDIGPHPHIGLATVTWLLDGQVLHRDSLGSEQVIHPGQLNLMSAGAGITHSEEATGHYRGQLEGIQLWLAQPDASRNGDARFEHHGELPRVDVGNGELTVLVGAHAGAASPAHTDSPVIGAELALSGGVTELQLRPDWEYGVVVLRGALQLSDDELTPGRFGYLGEGRDELSVHGAPRTRAMLLGGEPFGEEIVMWWNFVARTRAELEQAYRSWQRADDRFGAVRSPLRRIDAPAPYWLEQHG
jgi:redox-sensitive bicupin YhaK (pirin superfamily)